ncbi:hypothetical protein [Micromonospora sp. I033]
MLPIALTCPVWWVARWTARTLATLAVLVACSFGAATLPIGGAATASSAPPVVASVEGLTLRADAAETVTGFHVRDGADRAVAVTLTEQGFSGGADRVAAGAESGPAGGDVVPPAVAVDRLKPVAASRAVTRAVDRPLLPAGPVPATVGPRAPPAR